MRLMWLIWLKLRCETAGLDGSAVFRSGSCILGSMEGDIDCEGLRRNLILVLLLVDDSDIEGEAGGIAVLCRGFGEV
jgi:hypothetical protein